MEELTDLQELEGERLSSVQIRGILQQIDLDVANLLRDGKLSALKYSVGGEPGATMDRAANLKALLAARSHYETLLREEEQRESAAWITTTADFRRNSLA